MKRGRKPKPTSLKLLEGSRDDRINHAEPKFQPGSDAAPEWLTGLALDHWNELAPLLASSRVLSAGDRTNLALLCQLYQRWRTDFDDWKAQDRYIRLSVEFGLTPSARSRIKASPEKPADEVADLNEFLKAQ